VPDRLRQVHIFAGLNDAALRFLASRAEKLGFPPWSVVLSEAEVGNQFYAIASGAVRVVKRFGRVDEVELARLGPGESFGEMCVVEPQPRSATIQTCEAAVLFRLAPADFYELFKAMPTQYSVLMLNIARDLARRLRRLDEVFAASQ
jgi:CRP/FNR family transcriptional regulator, cyclic AMP receptor protein